MTSGITVGADGLVGSVSVELVRALLEFAAASEQDQTVWLDTCGLGAVDLLDRDARLPMADFARLLRLVISQTGRPGLVVEFAAHADFSEVSIAGLIANASETMLDALMQLNRYSRLTIETPFQGEMPLRFERGRTSDWIIDQRLISGPMPEIVELAFSYLITGPRRFLPQSHIVSVELAGPQPAHSEVYDRIWACPVRYNTGRNALELERWVADHVVRLQPAYAFGILTEHADRMLDRLRADQSFTAQVEALIMPRLHTGEVGADWVAGQLHLSRQSLYRRLREEDQRFEDLLDRLRHTLARAYLSAGQVSVSETAYLLGYSEPSPFSRAFKRWEGVSPRQYQVQNQSPTGGPPG